MHVLNDIHMGVKRTAGTTPASQKALADWQMQQFRKLLDGVPGRLLINGDLFDTFDVDNQALLRTYEAFCDWLEDSPVRQLYLVAGNHDLSKDSAKLSAFHLLGRLIERRFDAKRVWSVTGCGQRVGLALHPDEVWVIPHVANQDLFDAELARIPADARFVLLHCNYDNRFAEQADHSLNLSEQAAEKIPGFIVLGHEHQHRFALDERVVVVGNQIPTSVADCLGAKHKYVAFLDQKIGGVRLEPCLEVSSVYTQLDWRELAAYSGEHLFIRVSGPASADKAADALTAIAKFRARSEAFVITNAIEVEGTSIMEGVVQSIERAKSFDVIEAVLSMLDDKERAVVRRLFGERDAA